LKQYDIHRFQVSCDIETTRTLVRQLENTCSSTSTALTKGFKKTISGWIWNKNLAGYIEYDPYGEVKTLSLLTSSSYFDSLIKPSEEITVVNPKKDETRRVFVFYRYGSYEHFGYSRTMINVALVPTISQSILVSDIAKFYRKNKRCSVFIEGPPCSGKSSIGYLLAKEIDGSFCNTFNPTDPGDTINRTITSINDWIRDENDPIIILIDEIDVFLKKIHTNQISINHKTPTSVTDKQTWSKFMDNNQFFKNLIIIFTSNTPKTDIDALDSSYLRRGRIDLSYKLDLPISSEVCETEVPAESPQ
jgi:hypothetical protein